MNLPSRLLPPLSGFRRGGLRISPSASPLTFACQLRISPDVRGAGLGRQLYEHALAQQKPVTSDANARYAKAVVFYIRIGFVGAGRLPEGHGGPVSCD
ncbi:GNAT family N-acetyltransferase [Stenotrophomonas cyclobalanopsidis]|uniref:GNAT family N-acetyltransferase n=1 Tax=Stenotrophomonas cyclobalanopsidis TaxID=2771362 RepID=UPI003CCC77DE